MLPLVPLARFVFPLKLSLFGKDQTEMSRVIISVKSETLTMKSYDAPTKPFLRNRFITFLKRSRKIILISQNC